MQFGVCKGVDDSAAVKAAGWDFIEENVQGLLQGEVGDAEWKGMDRAKRSELPVVAANCLVPGHLKITGPEVNMPALTQYMATVTRRASMVGMKVLVFGSGGARKVPDGFDMEQAFRQVVDFAKMAADQARQNGVTIVMEHLHAGETNIINTVAEGMKVVRAVNHPNFQCLVDSWHLWKMNEPLENLKAAMPWIKHVHLADKEGRVPPGATGKNDYKPLFRVLKDGGYTGVISVEAIPFDFPKYGVSTLEFLKNEWEKC